MAGRHQGFAADVFQITTFSAILRGRLDPLIGIDIALAR